MPPLPPTTLGPHPGPAAGAIPFESLAEIAAGATARVDLCRVLPPHPRAGGLIAVKRLHPHVAEDPTFAREFLDEVWMTASLRHPNVVEVAGWGSDAQGEYLAFELVQGVSLLRLMKTIFETGEAFTERMVVYIASRICRGLAAAHSLRAPSGELLHLVHRDLTPGNLLCGFNGEVKIADFGMAKAKQRLTKTLTGMRKGEPTYMAPEQANTDDIDARADLFSLGVMLFELFAGRRPWIAKSDYDMVQITTREPPADLRELRPKIDKELVNVVNRCLQGAPAARWQSAHEIGARLDEWLTVHGYQEDNEEALGRFVRRNAMRQMRWFERAIAGELSQPKVGRDLPRVPTYTEHSAQPRRPLDSASATTGATALPPAPAIARLPTLPRPVDPRSIRAANAVQQLKKLAPPVESPRARLRRRPAMDDSDGDPTDVQLRLGASQLGGAQQPGSNPEADDDTGEEVPTLVQKGDSTILALRAEARRNKAAADARAKTPYASPGPIADEESDQAVTDVKREEPPRRPAPGAPSRLPNAVSMDDPDSELPTTPLVTGRPITMGASPPNPRSGLIDPSEAPTPVARQKAKTTPIRQIPPSPDVPPRPFPTGKPGRPAIGAPTQSSRPRPATSASPPPPEKPSRTTARPPPVEPTASVVSLPPDAVRTSQHDDNQVFDRRALQQKLVSEESILAEADRLAIEAVRRNEEARAAQLRAERKAVAAKLAGEAAMIATDAVRLLRASGLAVAVKRLEEARALEQDLQSGKFPAGDLASSQRLATSSLPGPPSNTPPGYAEPPVMTVTQPSPLFSAGAASPPAQSPATAGGGGHVYPAQAPVVVPTFPSAPPPSPAIPPRPVFAASGSAASAAVAAPLVKPSAGPTPQTNDADALAARLQPRILGLPSTVAIALAAAGLIIVLLVILLLAK
jgi:eukaryotic-like serine/threonine-protein kinase